MISAKGYEVKYSEAQSNLRQLEFQIGDYNLQNIRIDGENFTKILFDNNVTTKKAGFAELPYVHATVMIDPVINVGMNILPGEYEEIPLTYPMLPSRGVIYRNQDPSTIPYTIDPSSMVNEWYPRDLALSTDPFIIRDIRGVSVYVYPFQYNAVTGTLRVYKNITVQLTELSTTPVNPLMDQADHIVREMDAIYRSVFINYDYSASRYDLTVGEYGDILVITTARDEDAIQPYVDWKMEKGYNVDIEVVAAGTSVNSIVDTAYAANNDLLYVQLVGDWDDIKCQTLSGGMPMDPQVGCVAGNDEYADIAVGRLSANSPADVTVQVNKIINFEKNPELGADWYSKSIGVASNQGPGDDNELDYEHIDVIFNDKLDPFTYSEHTGIYDPTGTATMVTNAVNAGATVINYCGHGYNQGWGSTGFSNSHVANLSNGNKLPFVVSVACNNGDFHTGTCFAEAWLRKENGGAIMFLGASISQPWEPPMRGQDYFMDVLIGGYDYAQHAGQNGITTAEQRTTLGAFIFNGLTLMCVESGNYDDWETAKTWNLFGDPSLQARSKTPVTLTLSSTLVMVGIPFSTTVTSPDGPVEGAMVTLSQNGSYFTAITDGTGMVTINHSMQPGPAKLVVTGFNTETIYDDVTVVPSTGAYVIFDTLVINDTNGNQNGLLDYTETVYFTISLTNVGSEDATDVTAIISTTNPEITLIDNTEFFGTIAAGATVTMENSYEITASESLPDGEMVMFDLNATSAAADETWVSGFTVIGHAPVLEFESMIVEDSSGNGNGMLDPGETADLIITVANSGSSEAYNAVGDMICDNTYVTLNNSQAVFGNLTAGQSAAQSFSVTADPATPVGESATFQFSLSADFNLGVESEFTISIGQIPVLLIDLDGNHNSPDSIEISLENLGVSYVRSTTFPESMSLYTSVFVCLGTYPDNHPLTSDEGDLLAEFINNGGKVYMEGADTWAYDEPTTAHQLFNIEGIADGDGDLSTLEGQSGSIVDGMSFNYSGDNSYIDHIGPVGTSRIMYMNMSPEYGATIQFAGEDYKTVGSSFEFGGLNDGDNSKDEYMIQILDFFGIQGIWTNIGRAGESRVMEMNLYPNPFRSSLYVNLNLTERSMVNLEIYDITGKKISTLVNSMIDAGLHTFTWNGSSDEGSVLAGGIYFVRLQTPDQMINQKVIRLK